MSVGAGLSPPQGSGGTSFTGGTVTSTIKWGTGLSLSGNGIGTFGHLYGPTDDDFLISSDQTGGDLILRTLGNSNIELWGSTGAAAAALNLITVTAGGGMSWGSGLGAITHISFPSDQPGKISTIANQNLVLSAGSGLIDVTASQLKMTAGTTGAATVSSMTNSPATVTTNPYTWLKMTASDGTAIFVPAWK